MCSFRGGCGDQAWHIKTGDCFKSLNREKRCCSKMSSFLTQTISKRLGPSSLHALAVSRDGILCLNVKEAFIQLIYFRYEFELTVARCYIFFIFLMPEQERRVSDVLLAGPRPRHCRPAPSPELVLQVAILYPMG